MDRLASMTVFTRVCGGEKLHYGCEIAWYFASMASKHVQDLEHHLSIRLLNRTREP